jgi:MarR family transcriptional regulator, transcriptional regulator for hemolysin
VALEQATRTVTEHSADVGWSLSVLLRALRAAVNAAVGDVPHGPRGYQLLTTVVHDQPPSQLALAEHLGIDRTVMTYLIDDLEAAGLVERRSNPADRRQRKVVATDAGRRTLAELERGVRAAEDHVLGALRPGERDTFRTLLRRVACDVRDVDLATDPCTLVDDVLKGATS